jgi:hypothetical protein
MSNCYIGESEVFPRMLPTKFDSLGKGGSILGRTSIKIAHLVAIRKQAWPPQAILVSAWLISKKCSLLKL